MMDIRTARKIADDIGDVRFNDDDRRRAYWRLDHSIFKTGDRDVAKQDRDRAQTILTYFGNRVVKGKYD